MPAIEAAGLPMSILVNPFSILSHSVNVLFLCLDLALNGLYIKLPHFAFAVMWGALYIFFHGIFMLVLDHNDMDHCPAYFFLDLSTPFFTLWCIGLLLALFIFYLVGMGFSAIKAKVVARACPYSYSAPSSSFEMISEKKTFVFLN
jgi:hypothetical protein